MKVETERVVRAALNCDTTILPSVREAAITTLKGETIKGIGRTLTYKETATAIGRSVSAVRSLITRGILKTVKSHGMKRARGVSEASVRQMMNGGAE